MSVLLRTHSHAARSMLLSTLSETAIDVLSIPVKHPIVCSVPHTGLARCLVKGLDEFHGDLASHAPVGQGCKNNSADFQIAVIRKPFSDAGELPLRPSSVNWSPGRFRGTAVIRVAAFRNHRVAATGRSEPVASAKRFAVHTRGREAA